MHSIYFISYGMLTTVGAIVMAWAYYVRFKREGAPVNYPLLLLVAGVSLAMWTGAALTEFAYDVNPTTAGLAAFSLGIVFSSLFAWQVYLVMRNIRIDKEVIEELSTHDALTGLWNRRVFHEYLHSEITRSRSYRQPLSLLMIDIDNLPEFNDKHGFMRGDMVLREVGSRMMEAVRSMDCACRFVDGVVAVVLPKMNSGDTIDFAERLNSLMTSPFDIGDGQSATLTFSIAIVSYPEHEEDESSLIAGVLRALNAARDSGGDTTYLFTGEGECQQINKTAHAE